MSRSFFIWSVIIFLQPLQMTAQITPRTGRPIVAPPTTNVKKSFASSITITDVNGRPFQNPQTEIGGSPYFIDEFRYARLTLNLGSIYEAIRLKINLSSEEAHVLSGENTEIIAEKGLIRFLTLEDSANHGIVQYRFQTGYPPIDKNTVYTFYQVLSEGNLQLLKQTRKEIEVTQDVMTREVSKSYVKFENYFIFRNNEIIKLKKDKEFVLELMKDREKEVSEWLKKNKTNFKNLSSLTRLFDYYNSLFPGV